MAAGEGEGGRLPPLQTGGVAAVMIAQTRVSEPFEDTAAPERRPRPAPRAGSTLTAFSL